MPASSTLPAQTRLDHARQLLETVCDPEIPALTIAELGILRDLHWHETDDTLEVVITPTYSGCPAMNAIEVNIRAALQEGGFERVKVTTVLSPAWTTEWLTESGRQKLLDFGIAPPVSESLDKKALLGESKAVACPLCRSTNTKMISQFGSTACKALFRCMDCLEPFDYFKCH
jgi:ring-1,2-phenylacetyl-CoA epoxidase subunit PaaD